ncbi:MAG: crosslink repair DNA glycosylase YcaQ family protein [Desulfocapsaceae bacterium]|nr:crosslink repair DNA glycosylase YcaQ family protein [Desulfocapsaceae bacterium]
MREKLRRITLQHQGLTTLRPFGKGLQATQRAIEHLGYIQIDTISIVERAHHHTLWTRIPGYQPAYLANLVSQRRVFEYWFHAASFLPMTHYRFVLPQMAAIRRGESRYFGDVEEKYLHNILERIRLDGPCKARDFASTTRRNSTWWDWKPAKRALEKLFMQGDLMITDRDGMEKVYDLTERVLPNNINTCEPSVMELAEYLLKAALQANGFTTQKQVTHLRPGNPLRKALATVLHDKMAQGELQECQIDGMPKIYITPEIFEAKRKKPTRNVRILSPFDNAIIHRDRAQQLFGFEYRLECYTPKEKRKFGYFCLPILYQDSLVGRVDCKAHRKMKSLELIHLHLESQEVNLERFIPHFAKEVYRFAHFNDCETIHLSACSPKRLANTFRKVLSRVAQEP